MEKWVLIVNFGGERCIETRLQQSGYEFYTKMVFDLNEVVGCLVGQHRFLLVILYTGDNDVFEVIKIIRSLTEIPILVLCEKYEGEDKVAAIDAGADEYIPWPESYAEGEASARALIRRFTVWNKDCREAQAFLYSGFLINPEQRRVYVNEQEIVFQRREFDLFYLLAANPGRVFTYEQLYRNVWGDEYLKSEHGLNSCLRRIRRKLDMIPEITCHIENRRGVGYCFKIKEH